MTKDQLAKKMKLDQLGQYDCALPQEWLDAMADHAGGPYPEVRDRAYQTLLSGVVWFYPDKPGFSLGYPFPITTEAAELLD